MGDKVKPWHDRKPKHGQKENKGKRVSPLRPGNERVSPLRVNDQPLVDDDYEDWDDEVTWKT